MLSCPPLSGTLLQARKAQSSLSNSEKYTAYVTPANDMAQIQTLAPTDKGPPGRGPRRDVLQCMLSVLMNLTHNNAPGCAAVLDAGGLHIVISLIDAVLGPPEEEAIFVRVADRFLWPLYDLSPPCRKVLACLVHQFLHILYEEKTALPAPCPLWVQHTQCHLRRPSAFGNLPTCLPLGNLCVSFCLIECRVSVVMHAARVLKPCSQFFRKPCKNSRALQACDGVACDTRHGKCPDGMERAQEAAAGGFGPGEHGAGRADQPGGARGRLPAAPGRAAPPARHTRPAAALPPHAGALPTPPSLLSFWMKCGTWHMMPLQYFGH